jgi:hypothetical protein
MDWLRKVESTNDLSLEELQEDSNVYLLPDYEDAADIEKAIEKYIKSNYAKIFVHELTEWYLDPALYPKITYDAFLEWFKVSVHTMIYDTVNLPIEKE